MLYRPARQHRLAASIPQNRFLGAINVYKYGLRKAGTTKKQEQQNARTTKKAEVPGMIAAPIYRHKECYFLEQTFIHDLGSPLSLTPPSPPQKKTAISLAVCE
jgi:hypothetical protein